MTDAPRSRFVQRFEAVLPLLLTVAGAALLLLGGWRLADTGETVTLGPFVLSRSWGRRLVVFGVGLLVGQALVFPTRPNHLGWAARVRARLPSSWKWVPFVGGAWLAWAAAVKTFSFLGMLWVPHPDRGPASLWRLWLDPLCRDWDAAWYRSIAFEGYIHHGGASNVAFFPLYPLLVRGAAYLVPDRCLASWAVSQGALLLALAGLYRLSRARLGDDEDARWTVILLLAWPFAFFYAATYTEALFLCLAVWAFHFAERRRFWISGLLGALAAATRLTGICLLPALLLATPWRQPGDETLPRLVRLVRELRPRLPLFLVPGGTLAFFGYLHFAFGDFWANLRAAREGWGRGPGKGSHDLSAAASALFEAAEYPHQVIYAVYLLLALALLPLVRRLPARHGWGYTLFVLGIALPGALSGLEAFGRYLAPAFPLAWMLVPAARQAPPRAALAVLLLSLFQGLFLFFHTHGLWIT
jgi:hypothetical protein